MTERDAEGESQREGSETGWRDDPETGWLDRPEDGLAGERSESDPNSLGSDPESLAPDPPEPPEPGAGDDTEAVALFWRLVVVFDVALLALAVGPMFIFLEGRQDLGLRILLVGVVTFAYGAFRYYRFRVDRDDSPEDATGNDSDGGGAEDNG